MSGLYGLFKTDTAKEQEGIKIQYPANPDGTVPTFTVRRLSASNKAYHAELERLKKPHQRKIQLGTLPEGMELEFIKAAFLKTCVKGWENVQGPDGVEIPFSLSAASDLFKDLPDLYADLLDQATNIANYRNEDREVATGNS